MSEYFILSAENFGGLSRQISCLKVGSSDGEHGSHQHPVRREERNVAKRIKMTQREKLLALADGLRDYPTGETVAYTVVRLRQLSAASVCLDWSMCLN